MESEKSWNIPLINAVVYIVYHTFHLFLDDKGLSEKLGWLLFRLVGGEIDKSLFFYFASASCCITIGCIGGEFQLGLISFLELTSATPNQIWGGEFKVKLITYFSSLPGGGEFEEEGESKVKLTS